MQGIAACDYDFTYGVDGFASFCDLAMCMQWIACALAPAITIAIMAKLGLIHPPAVATCVIYLNDIDRFKQLDWLFLAAPLMLDCSVSAVPILCPRTAFDFCSAFVGKYIFRCHQLIEKKNCPAFHCAHAYPFFPLSSMCLHLTP